MKRFFLFLIMLCLIVPSIAFAEINLDNNPVEDNLVDDNLNESVEFLSAKAKVLEIVSDTQAEGDDELSTDLSLRTQVIKLKVLDGKFKGKEFTVNHALSGNFAYDIVLEKGDEVVLNIQENGTDSPGVYITDFVRDKYLFALVIIFIALLIIVGGLKGVKSVITLIITGVVIMYGMLPLILKGYSPLIVTVIAAIFIALMTFFIVGGINSKSISALIGTTGGVLTAGILAYIVGSLVKLTGLSSEEAGMLLHIPQGIVFDFRSLLFSGIIIGTLGAVMDVTMSIASAMYELKDLSPDIDHKSLIKSGLNIGKDIMGTMSNTLILAYTGSSVPLLLVFMSYSTSLSKILNLDLIATEVVRALVGSIGLVIAIPITALATGLILKSQIKKVQ